MKVWELSIRTFRSSFCCSRWTIWSSSARFFFTWKQQRRRRRKFQLNTTNPVKRQQAATFTSASMFWSFLLCSCTCSLFISMTNNSDSCSDSQNAPGLPWACRQKGQTLKWQQQGGRGVSPECSSAGPCWRWTPGPSSSAGCSSTAPPSAAAFQPAVATQTQLKKPAEAAAGGLLGGPDVTLLPSARPGQPETSPSAGLCPPRGPSSAPSPSARIPLLPLCSCTRAQRSGPPSSPSSPGGWRPD